MTDAERRSAADKFVADWKNRGDEKQETQRFWIALLQNVYGAEQPTETIEFEKRVEVVNNDGTTTTKYIDGYIPATRTLIEQKGMKIDLKKGERQSDGAMLTPFQQGRRYGGFLPNPEQPRWIVVCNFQTFEIHDMNRPNDEPEVLLLSDLEKDFHRLDFLVDTGKEHIKKEMEISLQAGELVGVLYDALLKQYKDPTTPETLKSLNKLCVRLVFCLYAEDAGIFGSKSMFHDYLENHRSEDRRALINLFRVLDQDIPQRDKYLDDDLAAFPYVNGGLFADEDIEIPRLGDEVIDLILRRASEDFNWSDISPTIFGAVFESTLNPETRRSGGMHYTSIENIHKVIDPLFLDGLKAEFEEISAVTVDRTRKAKLEAFQRKLASLKFLDPACGSGNFLTETYISLRRLENETISLLHKGQIMLDMGNPIQVSIGQFYGIEINDFAVTVAKTALWIAESQMMKETEDVVHMTLDFLPLKSYANITEANALRIDWESVVPKHELNYIMGNPPFVGQTFRSKEQAEEIKSVFSNNPKAGKLDYVAAWYKLAATYMQGTQINAAFVSTNSISQGEQVAILWRDLFEQNNVEITFAHRSFVWTSEAVEKAAVHCVIIGFSCYHQQTKCLFEHNRKKEVSHINGYLVEGADVFIKARGTPSDNSMPKMTQGSKPVDSGNLIYSQEEHQMFITSYPVKAHLLKRFMGSADFINNKIRYCLWLKGIPPNEYRGISDIMQRLEACAQARAKSPTPAFRAAAETPMLFAETRQPTTTYLVIPEVSSERRRYVPIGYVEPDIIAANTVYVLPNASIYMFGIMTSNVHMAWMRTVCSRMKSDYRYTPAVYNNFPWPTPTNAQKEKIEQTAQAILDARALYPDSSLADLYDETTMPPELRKAHQMNDKAVMLAYGFSVRDMTESKCVAELMRMYQQLTQEKQS